MPLKSGSPRNKYAESMAAMIEQAFNDEWNTYMGGEAPPTNDQMKLLCVAIAKGVINHLCTHPEAFIVKTNVEGIEYTATVKIEQE
ncbi:MAG: hypothetical protein NTU98_00150 [Bacteroidetes bacterium]|nr:hypothetical protein [Bacteroidota bacterium]